jgi:DNA-binding CsgD family transcriptional regulator
MYIPVNLAEEDVRAMVRLIGEVAALEGGHAEKKRFLMDGLGKLINADIWAWSLSCQRDPTKPQVNVSFLSGGLGEKDMVHMLEAVEHPEMIPISSKFFLEVEEKQSHLTRRRFQITDEATFKQTGAHDAWKLANIGPTIMSLRPLDERSSSVVALFRHYDKKEFSERDSRIAHIILTEVPWLHEQGWPEDRGIDVPSLSKRQRLTLNLLTQGQSRKQIAENMKISLNTAQGYIKTVYSRFNVNSQAELMSRFLHGNGRDFP